MECVWSCWAWSWRPAAPSSEHVLLPMKVPHARSVCSVRIAPPHTLPQVAFSSLGNQTDNQLQLRVSARLPTGRLPGWVPPLWVPPGHAGEARRKARRLHVVAESDDRDLFSRFLKR